MAKITLLLVDEHPLLRKGLRSLLETDPHLQVIGEADDGIDALSQVEQLRPDILITGLNLPGISGVELIKLVRRQVPLTKIIVYTSYKNRDYIRRSLKAGVAGYIVKDAVPTDVVEAVTVVAAGGRFLSEIISSKPEATTEPPCNAFEDDLLKNLTNREKEILVLSARGDKYADIAQQLFISPRTVETHRTNAMKKIGLRSRADLVKFAIHRGLLPTDGALR